MGEEGPRQVEIDAPDLILCDLHLPGIDGSAVVVEAEHGPIRRQLRPALREPGSSDACLIQLATSSSSSWSSSWMSR